MDGPLAPAEAGLVPRCGSGFGASSSWIEDLRSAGSLVPSATPSSSGTFARHVLSDEFKYSLSKEFHTYSMEWKKDDSFSYYLDNQDLRRIPEHRSFRQDHDRELSRLGRIAGEQRRGIGVSIGIDDPERNAVAFEEVRQPRHVR